MRVLLRGRQEQCTVCGEVFAATGPGDDHRVGPYEPRGARRCRTPEEMRAGGMWTTQRPDGVLVWHGDWNKAGIQKRRTP